MSLTEIMAEDYIGSDIKKILAAYNQGQGILKYWLDFCQENSLDWYENLLSDIDGARFYDERVAIKKYIDKVLSYYN